MSFIKNKKFYWSLLIIYCIVIYSPIIPMGENRYYPPEFLLYFCLLPYVLIFKKDNIFLSKITKILLRYVFLYVLVIITVILLKGDYLRVHLYQFRLVLMSFCWSFFLDNYFINKNIIRSRNTFKAIIYISIVAPLIALLSFFSEFFRLIVYKFYVPVVTVYESVGIVFAGFREPGIFKDYYTATLFYFVLLVGLLLYHFKYQIYRFKVKEILSILIILSSAMISGRTGFYASFILMLLIFIKYSKRININLNVLVLLPFLFILIYYFLNKINSDTLNWAFELFNKDEIKSNEGLKESIYSFWIYIYNNVDFLFIPMHEVDFNINLEFYSDSFYSQEIIRHGIYGIIIYLIFIYQLIIHFLKQNNFIGIILIFFMAIFNLKGGNVFFLERYSMLLWVVIMFTDRKYFFNK